MCVYVCVYSFMYIYFYIIILFIYFSFFLEDTPKYRDNVEIIRNNIEIVCGTATGFLFFFIPFFFGKHHFCMISNLPKILYYNMIYERERERERFLTVWKSVVVVLIFEIFMLVSLVLFLLLLFISTRLRGKKITTARLYDILSIVSAYSLWPWQHPI